VGVAAGLPNLSHDCARDIRLGDILVVEGDSGSAGLIGYDLGRETSCGLELLHGEYSLANTEPMVSSAIRNIKIHAYKTGIFFLEILRKHKGQTAQQWNIYRS
jgi:hypothetical protein